MKKTFLKHKPGTAAFVVQHGLYMASRGKNPSMTFLTETNPRQALELAKVILESQEWRELVNEVASLIVPSHIKKPFNEMGTQEIEIALRHIVTTSSSEEEIRRRIKDELKCPGHPTLHIDQPKDQVGEEARELVKALGGLVTKTGAMVMIMIHGPDGEVISV